MQLTQEQTAPSNTSFSVSDKTVELVPLQSVADAWTVLAPLIDRAMAYGDGKFSKRFIFDSIAASEIQMWAPRDMSVVLLTRISDYPEMRVCELFLCGGDNLNEVLADGLGKVEEFARSFGAKRLEIWGRKGWGRYLKEHGFAPQYHIVTKEL